MEVPGQLPGISIWDWGEFWYDCRIGSYNIICECTPFWHWLSDVSAEPFRHEGLVPYMVKYKYWSFLTLVVKCKCIAFWHVGLVPRMAECKCWYFLTLVDGCECWAFLTGLWEVFPHGQMWVLGVPFWYDYRIGSYMIRCKCWASHSDLGSDISAGRRPTWRLCLQPTWKRVGSVELLVTRRIKR